MGVTTVSNPRYHVPAAWDAQDFRRLMDKLRLPKES
jgi:hypothetical protein